MGSLAVIIMEILDKLFKEGNVSQFYDEAIKDINNDESVKSHLASKIGEDIQQYIDAKTWGDERPVIEVSGDEIYVVAFCRRMPPVVFYSCVFNNSGKVTKDLFITYSEDKEKTAED